MGCSSVGFLVLAEWLAPALAVALVLLALAVAFGVVLWRLAHRWTGALGLANEEMRQRLREVEQTQAELEEAEREKALVLSTVAELVVYQDRDRRIRWANRAAADSVGMELDALVGRRCYDVWHGRNAPCPLCPVTETLESGEPREGEVTSPDGRRWHVRGYPVRDEEGEIVGAVDIAYDISVQRRAEEAARASEEKFRKAFESCPDPMIITTMEDGRILDTNSSVEEAAGYQRAEIVGRTTLELGFWGEAEERARFVGAIRRNGRVRDFEATFRVAGGREIIGLVSAEPIELGGRRCLLSTVKVITERREAERALRESEAKFRALIEAVPHCVAIFQDNRVAYLNPAGLRTFGCAGPEDIVGRDVVELVARRDRERLAGYVRARAEGRADVPTHYFATLRRMSGEEFPAEVYVTPTVFNGRPAWQVMSIDITDRQRAEEELRRYREHLEELVAQRTGELAEVNAELEAFAYSVSHDLRAPLRAMEGFAEALLEDYAEKLDPEGRDYARSIAQAASKMDAFVCDLLAYSHIGRGEAHLERVDLDAVVEELVAGLGAQIHERGATVEVKGPLPAVLAHYATLVQVVGNLLSNALKFVELPASPHVRLWAEADGEWVRVWFEDNGIGIAPEHHERIFRVFERLHGADKYCGTGIGLAIVRRGVERMGGRVGLESEPGRGSRFFVELPRAGEQG